MTRLIPSIRRILTGQRGAVLILVALLLLFVLLGFAAFAIDFGYSYVVKNELQNAADAAALAGASVLFRSNQHCVASGRPYVCCSGARTGSCDPGVIDSNNVTETARAVAALNSSGGNPVPAPIIEIGHYAFASSPGIPGTFSAAAPAYTYTQLSDWQTQSFSALNGNANFINAVRATVSRTDVPRFFSRIWSSSDLAITAQAVAYIGFAGNLLPGEADQPIAICKQSIVDGDGNYTCNTGRMLNSGNDAATHNTAAWTNFTQPCETANADDMKKMICATGNPKSIVFGQGIGATGGVQDVTITALRNCFDPARRTEPWSLTLPVIDCPGNNPSNCSTVVGAVDINVVWVSDKDANTDKEFEKELFPPSRMGNWSCPPTCSSRLCCWNDFVAYFNLQNVDGITATYAKKSIYFLPSCTVHEPTGNTGGENFGILARYPVLVK